MMMKATITTHLTVGLVDGDSGSSEFNDRVGSAVGGPPEDDVAVLP